MEDEDTVALRAFGTVCKVSRVQFGCFQREGSLSWLHISCPAKVHNEEQLMSVQGFIKFKFQETWSLELMKQYMLSLLE